VGKVRNRRRVYFTADRALEEKLKKPVEGLPKSIQKSLQKEVDISAK